MKTAIRFSLAAAFALAASCASADSTPDVLHYKFNDVGTSVTNLASSPPVGTATATIMGSLTQTGVDLNYASNGYSLMGSGNSSSTDYLNTGWAPDLGTGSWTIAFFTQNFTASATLFYIFGDANTNSFRCFTNGVALPNNWILRGAGLTDTFLYGGATVANHHAAFVYDSVAATVTPYLDGVAGTPVAQGAVNVTGSGPFKVMGYSTNVGAPAGGLIDDFRVYRRALSAAEIAAIDTFGVASVSGNAVTIADGDSTPDPSDDTDFGGVGTDVAETATHTFTITNNGTADLAIGAVTITGSEAADFTLTSAPTSPIPPAGSTTFDITFDPSADGLRSATVSFGTNDATNSTYDFAIQGTGLDVIFRNGFE